LEGETIEMVAREAEVDCRDNISSTRRAMIGIETDCGWVIYYLCAGRVLCAGRETERSVSGDFCARA